MKIKEGFKLRNVAGMTVAVPVGAIANDYANMLMLNDVSLFLWNMMQNQTSEESLIDAVLENYDVEINRAEAAVRSFVETMRREKILEE